MLMEKEKPCKESIGSRTLAMINKQLQIPNIINNVMSGLIIGVFLFCGILSKEYLILYLISKGINIATDILVR